MSVENIKPSVLTERSNNIYSNLQCHISERKRVAYVFSDIYLQTCDSIPKVRCRASLVHSLIESYGLLNCLCLVEAKPAGICDIEQFHSAEYIQMLKSLSEEEDDEKYDEEAEQYGLTYDCPAWPGVYNYACFVTGGSLKAAEALLTGMSDIAINWPGGWHHAKRDEAAGFCYFNDIVIAILSLRKKFDRILYVDIDLHHGDGVEDAFCATTKVFTLSFHKVSPGFFPGTGKISDVGMAKGKYHTLNVPVKDGIQDEQYFQIFKRAVDLVNKIYQPDAVVCQCGADGLYGDPMSSFNLTTKSLVNCVKYLKSWNLPLLLLGGGGYNLPNTARCWTEITAAVLDKTISDDIPEHKYFTQYGPDYQLRFEPGNQPNHNNQVYIDSVFKTVEENLSHLTNSQ